MPEGPSLVILKEQVQEFIGRKILKVTGNSKEDIRRMQGKKVQDFKTWGKHFLICFNDFTVRVHFMLFGSYRVNESREMPPRMGMAFKNGFINFYACSIKILEADLDAIYDWNADIMSNTWDPREARAKLKAQSETLLCDALLDQQIFAGAGNIIKNEVLYRVRLHPLNIVAALPSRKLTQLITETRNYAFDFLKWKKEFTLRKHWLAHTKKTCERCHLPLIKAYPGKTRRRTYYCENCQLLYESK